MRGGHACDQVAILTPGGACVFVSECVREQVVRFLRRMLHMGEADSLVSALPTPPSSLLRVPIRRWLC